MKDNINMNVHLGIAISDDDDEAEAADMKGKCSKNILEGGVYIYILYTVVWQCFWSSNTFN